MTRYLVFSDVHGNLPALETMLNRTRNDVDGYICLGDTVNYGPWSNECVDLIQSLDNCVYLEGNHEEYFLNGNYPGKNIVAKTFFDFCYPLFYRKEAITGLPKFYNLNGYSFSHTINEQYIYPNSNINLDNNYVIGHSHHQFIINQSPYMLYNPGSVGQNRKQINIINYMILEAETMTFEKHSVTYDVGVVIKEMKNRHYPQLCVDYYDKKERA